MDPQRLSMTGLQLPGRYVCILCTVQILFPFFLIFRYRCFIKRTTFQTVKGPELKFLYAYNSRHIDLNPPISLPLRELEQLISSG